MHHTKTEQMWAVVPLLEALAKVIELSEQCPGLHRLFLQQAAGHDLEFTMQALAFLHGVEPDQDRATTTEEHIAVFHTEDLAGRIAAFLLYLGA